MTNHILKCPKCRKYTMRPECADCKVKTIPPLPAKYSPEDPYGKYRREAKKEQLKKEGIL
ncbi:nucleolar RNA-binding Nop10p family protein [Nanoarchaeota archaeon]